MEPSLGDSLLGTSTPWAPKKKKKHKRHKHKGKQKKSSRKEESSGSSSEGNGQEDRGGVSTEELLRRLKSIRGKNQQ
ncbi:G patch domain-containing protein 1-like isoform X2 [Salmo trutta]|uniref:G patch domain-containing protein 1-like isoform X2 n=1 Tax=Salmo trutta TaxID=8032 RepID=UPI0011306EE7|nr:G patch domain-containing protein 1-like isoform X2 [Salmo trutta]